MTAKRVLLVDDHPIFREGMGRVIATHPGLRVVAECGDLDEALQLVSSEHPDLLVTDLRLAQESGHELIRRALQNRPALRVLVISVSSSEAEVQRSLEAGATAYLTKGASKDEMLQALNEVLAGRPYLHSQVSSGPSEPAPGSELTQREQQILEMLLAGKTNKEISEILSLSILTVKSHVRTVYRKRRVSSRTELLLQQLEEQRKDARS